MYEAPSITEIGSFAELTLQTINKTTGGTDTVIYTNPDGSAAGSITIPGHNPTLS